MRRLELKAGDTFNGISYLYEYGTIKGRRYCWFKCFCGKEFSSRIDSVTLTGCGCGCNQPTFRHGFARKNKKSKIYSVWNMMLERCQNDKNSRYKYYGARGIKVCERWHDFVNFHADMGECPEGFSIDRIDNDGNYEPTNCKWVSKVQQQRNTSRNHFIEYNGKRQTLVEWAIETGHTGHAIYKRLKRGWSVERALFEPSKRTYT